MASRYSKSCSCTIVLTLNVVLIADMSSKYKQDLILSCTYGALKIIRNIIKILFKDSVYLHNGTYLSDTKVLEVFPCEISKLYARNCNC